MAQEDSMKQHALYIPLIGILLASFAANAIDYGEPILFDNSYGQRLPGSSSNVGLWWASSGWKVSKDRPMPKRAAKAILVSAARNEAEAVQLVLRPSVPLTGFRASSGALEGPSRSAIPADRIDVLRVRYVDIERPSDRSSVAAPWPDPLPPFKGAVDLAAGENHPLWIRVHVPKDAAGGLYQGAIQIRADGYSADVPLNLRVYGFELPDRMTLQTAFGFNPSNIYSYQKITDPHQRREVLEKYWANLSAHHVSPYNPTPNHPIKVEWVKLGAGERTEISEEDGALLESNALTPVLNWSEWDAEIARVFSKYHFQTFRLGIPGLRQRSLQGFGEDTREYELAFTAYCQTVQEHLREKGLLDAAYVYWYDEPTTTAYPIVMRGFRKLKEAAPDIRRMLTEQVEPELHGGPNLWCPLTMWYDHERAEERRQAGDRFWWYICTIPKAPYPGLFTDHAGTEFRVWLWQTWKYGMDGILIWSSNLWTTGKAYPKTPQNPYEDPMSWISDRHAKVGEKVPWGNGDGRFIYPPEAAATGQQEETVLDGPVDSIRWEMLRDGIEDYEYMVLLKRLLEAKKKEGLSRRKYRRYAALLEVPKSVTADLKTFTKDPAPIEAHRNRVAEAIERLSPED